MIPRQIHYVWVGGPLPEEQREFIQTWRATNPDYEIVRWDESNIDFSIPPIKEAYDRQRWAKVADIVRLLVVAEYGGIYLDTDFRIFKSLDILLRHACFYGFQYEAHPTDWVANGAFGAEANHWFVRQALARLLAMPKARFGLERPTASGPKLITKLLREEGLRAYSPNGTMVKDIFVCPVPVFYPFSMEEEFTPACITTQTLGAHFWSRSWEKDLPPIIRRLRKVRLAVSTLLSLTVPTDQQTSRTNRG
jgi:mannosyltransferase OCH1-like enzyme